MIIYKNLLRDYCLKKHMPQTGRRYLPAQKLNSQKWKESLKSRKRQTSRKKNRHKYDQTTDRRDAPNAAETAQIHFVLYSAPHQRLLNKTGEHDFRQDHFFTGTFVLSAK